MLQNVVFTQKNPDTLYRNILIVAILSYIGYDAQGRVHANEKARKKTGKPIFPKATFVF